MICFFRLGEELTRRKPAALTNASDLSSESNNLWMPSRPAIIAELLICCWRSYCFRTDTQPISPPVCNASSNTCARTIASVNPMFTPCPARGWTVCAASPIKATRGTTYRAAWASCRGNAPLGPGASTTYGGASSAGPGSPASTRAASPAAASLTPNKSGTRREVGCCSGTAVAGEWSASFTAAANSGGVILASWAARAAVVDQTTLEKSPAEGSSARGPVLRKRCQAVRVGKSVRTVDTTA
mmetsp:Transcript_15954/g.30624  ORF Transcript_15954/g.30624 Transcript_15954/m.30624 type:complete len:242 (+) Transcript_15954:360-1085(+)